MSSYTLPVLGAAVTTADDNSSAVTIGTFGSTPDAKGASISAQVVTMQPADATHPGEVSAAAQTFGGVKTFAAGIASSVASGADAITLASGQRVGMAASAYITNAGSNTIVECGGWNLLIQNGGLIVPAGFTANFNGGATTSGNVVMNISGNTTDGGSAIGVKLRTNNTFSTAGSKLVSVQNNTTEVQATDLNGKIIFSQYTDNSGTAGATTISKVTGRAAIASGASSVVVTNTLVSATSIVLVQLEKVGGGIGGLAVVPGTGSFTVTSLNGTGVATNTSADTKFSFIVFNA